MGCRGGGVVMGLEKRKQFEIVAIQTEASEYRKYIENVQTETID